MKNREEQRLSEQILSILAAGGLIQLIFFLVTCIYPQFLNSKKPFLTGLWIGAATAVLLAALLHFAIRRALKMEQEAAEQYMRRIYALRLIVMLLVAAFVYDSGVGYVMALFLGMLCLQFGAFLQPAVHAMLSCLPFRKE